MVCAVIVATGNPGAVDYATPTAATTPAYREKVIKNSELGGSSSTRFMSSRVPQRSD